MFESRTFINEFSENINATAENDIDGIFITIQRFAQYISTLKKKVDADNINILKLLKSIDENEALSLSIRPDIVNQLDYFSNILLQSSIVSIYSFFDTKLEQLAIICKKHVPNTKTIDSFRYSGDQSYIEKHNSFLKSEIIPDLEVYSDNFERMLIWKNVRNYIVHRSKRSADMLDLTFLNSITSENGKLHIKDEKDILEFLILVEYYLEMVIDLINTKYLLIQYKMINS